MINAQNEAQNEKHSDSATHYQSLSEQADQAGMADLAERLSAYARQLETNERARADDFIAEAVEEAKAQVQRLLHSGDPGERAFLYTGIEGGALSEETLSRLYTSFGVPELRAKEPDRTAVVSGESRSLGQYHDVERTYAYDTGQGLGLELTVAELDKNSRVFTLDAIRR